MLVVYLVHHNQLFLLNSHKRTISCLMPMRKHWAVASKQAEQCIYPNLTRIQQQHFAKEDSYIHSQYVFFYPLEKIIGETM